MSLPKSLDEIDLAPIPGKKYSNLEREWREEFIYFLMVDRFHDDLERKPVLGSNRSQGVKAPDNEFYGGKIKGITRNLDYIAGLGCTAIWLSPVFVNNEGAYHGYNINNYLGIDPHFGTKQDLIDLVDAAHNYQKNGRPYPIRIILDVVINHSGDNWSYPGGFSYNYCNDQQFPFGFWWEGREPFPEELRNQDYYHRKGNINEGGWDSSPENQNGDLCGLKDFANDDNATGSEVINALIKVHAYWIKEADIDGFRVDAIKHMGAIACSRFCSNIREYAYSLGKRGFFLFGELAVPQDDIVDRYIGPNTSKQDDQTVFFGIDSVLDFPLAEGRFNDPNHRPLRDVLKGSAGPETLFNRLEAQRHRSLNRGEIGRFLVTFVDNHDSFWQTGRFGAEASENQIIGALGFLLCALGTPCIYYGTEQGFAGKGGDNDLREAMFDQDKPGFNLLNTDCRIYQAISEIALIMRAIEPLRFGRMDYRQISGDGVHFGFPYGTTYTLAFSRILYPSEVLIAYNVSGQAREDFVLIDAPLHAKVGNMSYLYGNSGKVKIQDSPDGAGAKFVQLSLAPYQFVILQ
jgi:glycosidase